MKKNNKNLCYAGLALVLIAALGVYFFYFTDTAAPPAQEVKFLSYEKDDGLGMAFRGTQLRAETFLIPPCCNYELTKVGIWAARITDATPGIITLKIVALDGSGAPAGSLIASSTYDGDTIHEILSGTSPTTYGLIYFNFPEKPTLSKGVQYGFVLQAPDADVGEAVYIAKAGENGVIADYEDGDYWWSTGTTWTKYAGNDINFQLYGFNK